MRPAASTAVASSVRSPAPDIDSEPRCCWCQSLALPSTALYWHIGDTAMRFSSVTPPMVIGVKRCEVIDVVLWWRLLYLLSVAACFAIAISNRGSRVGKLGYLR